MKIILTSNYTTRFFDHQKPIDPSFPYSTNLLAIMAITFAADGDSLTIIPPTIDIPYAIGVIYFLKVGRRSGRFFRTRRSGHVLKGWPAHFQVYSFQVEGSIFRSMHCIFRTKIKNMERTFLIFLGVIGCVLVLILNLFFIESA